MKRTGIKQQKVSQLNQRLELVRTTIRELTPNQLKYVDGGTSGKVSQLEQTNCGPFTTD